MRCSAIEAADTGANAQSRETRSTPHKRDGGCGSIIEKPSIRYARSVSTVKAAGAWRCGRTSSCLHCMDVQQAMRPVKLPRKKCLLAESDEAGSRWRSHGVAHRRLRAESGQSRALPH